jgi:hypothetical protein
MWTVRICSTFATTVLAIAAILLLQGCDEKKSPAPAPSTTFTTTFGCADSEVPWPKANPTPDQPWDCQKSDEAKAEMETFLKANMPTWDTPNQESLMEGIIPTALTHSFTVKDTYPWAEMVPKEIFKNYILPYANVNEGRVNWRPMLHTKLGPLVQNSTFEASNASHVVEILNEYLWSALRDEGQTKICFRADETPTFLDPMTVINYGYASCTGISILFVDALRSVGVPARLVGTLAWNGTGGNHNWIEIYFGPGKGLNGDNWTFIEGKPAQGANETLTDPCDKWFCKAKNFDGKTKVWAVKFDQTDRKTNASLYYPMAWDTDNKGIPGIDRTTFYQEACKACTSTTRSKLAHLDIVL